MCMVNLMLWLAFQHGVGVKGYTNICLVFSLYLSGGRMMFVSLL